MSRLWDKGAPLDARVLRYTAGEDHALDDRLVGYDVRASIAHAEGLHAAGLLSARDLETLAAALAEIGAAHARGCLDGLLFHGCFSSNRRGNGSHAQCNRVSLHLGHTTKLSRTRARTSSSSKHRR